MKKKITFRMSLIVSAFVLLTLPTMINATSSNPGPGACVRNCVSEFQSCMANTGGDPMCAEQFTDCVQACN